MNARQGPHSNVARWLPIGAACGLVAAVIAAGVITGGGDGDASADAPGAVASSSTTSTSVPQVVVDPTEVTVPKVPLDRSLGDGVTGEDVKMVQQRLTDLAFDPGPVDGVYGLQTKQAVWAFEKLVMGVPREEATGQVTPETWDRMQDPITIQPRRSTGGLADHTEIYLPEQVMVVFNADVPVLVTHISSGELDSDGEPKMYRDTVTYDTDNQGNPLPEPVTKPIIGWAKTPPGVFEAYRYVPGTRNGPLGSMWNPIYINQGIAIHGALTVPDHPASHGCIRVPMHISEYLWGLIDKGDKVLIWDGKKEPEDQTREDMQMIWDRADPDATTTTTTTTTTTSTTVPAAPTTEPPAEIPPPPTTTTTTSAPSATTTTTLAPQ